MARKVREFQMCSESMGACSATIPIITFRADNSEDVADHQAHPDPDDMPFIKKIHAWIYPETGNAEINIATIEKRNDLSFPYIVIHFEEVADIYRDLKVVKDVLEEIVNVVDNFDKVYDLIC